MVRITMKAIKAISLWLAGFFILPFILAFTPKGAKKLRWLDGIYGNKSSDGLDGDAGYQARVHRFRRYRWLAMRNPINNYLRSLGPNGTVASYVVIHNPNIEHAVLTLLDGSTWDMWDIHLIGKIHIWWCYKLLEDWRPEINSKLTKGHHFENMMLLWPIKKEDR